MVEPSKRELISLAVEVAELLFGHSDKNRKWILAKAKQINQTEPDISD